jgi:hypothetical protein
MDEDKRLETKLNYAWQWFSYHAGQRLQAFHFFLIIVGVIAVAYAQAIDHHWEVVGIALGVFGIFVGLAFWALDVRNQELVNYGLNALEPLESELTISVSTEASGDRPMLKPALGAAKPLAGAKWLFRHSLWLRLIELLAIALFAGATVWAAEGFPGVKHSDAKSCAVATDSSKHLRASACR